MRGEKRWDIYKYDHAVQHVLYAKYKVYACNFDKHTQTSYISLFSAATVLRVDHLSFPTGLKVTKVTVGYQQRELYIDLLKY